MSTGGLIDDPARTITGRAQLDWLKGELSASDTRWRLLGNSVMITPVAIGSLAADLLGPGQAPRHPEGGIAINADQWDGYTADRKELLAHLGGNIGNTVFLTGDIHTSWANDVPTSAAKYPKCRRSPPSSSCRP